MIGAQSLRAAPNVDQLEAVREKFEAKLQEEKLRWEEEAARVRADLINDVNYWKKEAEAKVCMKHCVHSFV